jgi:hypothetical protein
VPYFSNLFFKYPFFVFIKCKNKMHAKITGWFDLRHSKITGWVYFRRNNNLVVQTLKHLKIICFPMNRYS